MSEDARETRLDLDKPKARSASLEAAIAELERELDVRRRVFPDWVAKGRLDQATADARIASMQDGLASLAGLRHLGAIVSATVELDGPHSRLEVLLPDGARAVYVLEREEGR